MSYELYRNHRLAPDDNGCWDVLTNPEYEQRGTYPSKAAAKRAIDAIQDAPCDHGLPYMPKLLEMNFGTPIMFKYICRYCGEEAIYQQAPPNQITPLRRMYELPIRCCRSSNNKSEELSMTTNYLLTRRMR